MTLALRRCLKLKTLQKMISTCKPEPLTKDCPTQVQTINDLPVPMGSWISRYYMEQRSINNYRWAGFSMAAISFATLVKTDATWVGQNFQYISNFNYVDAAKTPKKDNPRSEESRPELKLKKVDYEIDEPSSITFFVLSALYAIGTLSKWF